MGALPTVTMRKGEKRFVVNANSAQQREFERKGYTVLSHNTPIGEPIVIPEDDGKETIKEGDEPSERDETTESGIHTGKRLKEEEEEKPVEEVEDKKEEEASVVDDKSVADEPSAVPAGKKSKAQKVKDKKKD